MERPQTKPHSARSGPQGGASAPRVPHVATYTRSLPVSLERLYENALDWEHLPFLHGSSFFSIDCRDSGDWGWRAEVGLQPRERGETAILELLLDRACRRWITRNLSGEGEGTEIWTHAFAVEDRRTDIVVDFFVPGIVPDDVPAVGKFYQQLYAQLYDEDVSMMAERQQQLDRIKTRANRTHPARRLGRLEDLRARLPLTVDIDGEAFRVVEVGGEMLAHSLVCPHRLGPLDRAEVRDGEIECPWHGYRFDVRSRQSVRGGQSCRLAEAPLLSIDPVTSEVTLAW
jgi:nitrite reductase/ring-hydroxylating ferredoxin subunit